MATINNDFTKLPGSYLFAGIARRVAAFREANPGRDVISLGIGDVTLPLPRACIEAMHRAVDDEGSARTFHGYGPEQGYRFLIDAIIAGDYAPRGIDISPDEVFVSDGAKSDTGNIGDILGRDNVVAVTDPVYPVYVDSNVMGGRTGRLGDDGRWQGLVYLPCTADTGFVPRLPEARVDVIYLCYPNNPTGTTLTREQLRAWVDYALANDALIMYDSAYEAFISEDDVPHSIYEIEGARRCAIEFRSYSKTAGFTGVRCGYTVVPREVTARAADGSRVPLNDLWRRRQCTKFNGASYITQRGAAAVYTPEGRRQVRQNIDYYMANARLMRRGLASLGLEAWGGVNAPYVWVKTPHSEGSWQFFDRMLARAAVVCTPGAGFGPSGEGYVRLSAFGSNEACREAMARLGQWLG